MQKKYEYNSQQSGNALLYVLVAIALFAGLSITLSRLNTTKGTAGRDKAQADFHATRLMTYAAQVQSAVEQMMFLKVGIDDLDFTLPSEAGFNTAPHLYKVYHPQGGGVTPAMLPEKITFDINGSLVPGWYLGRFNNTDWTPSTATDVMLTAYKINKDVCMAINEQITGSDAIPVLSGSMSQSLTDSTPDIDLTTALCADCEGYSALCVTNALGSAYSFYSVIAAR